MNQRMRLLILVFLIPTFSLAQSTDINGVFCTDVKSDAEGNVYVCGYFQGFVSFGRTMLKSNKGSTDIFLAKFSSNGGNIWAVKAGGEETDVATGLVIDRKGYVYVTGYFQETSTFEYRKIKSRGRADLFVAKYSPSGSINILKTFGGKGNEESVGIGMDGQGDIYVAGTYTDRFRMGDRSLGLVGSSSVFISKFNAGIRPEWSSEIGNAGGVILLNDMDVDKGGNVFICGSYTNTLIVGEAEIPSKGDLDAFAFKLSTTGGLVYSKYYASAKTDLARAISANNKGNAVLAGHTVEGMSNQIGYVYELDANGNKGKSKEWNLGLETKIQDLTIGINGELMICGSFSEFEQFGSVKINCSGVDGFLIKCSDAYKPMWGFASGGKVNGLVECMDIDRDGNNFIGVNRPRVQGSREQAVYLCKIDKDANLIWSTEVGAAEKSELYDPSARYIDFKGKLLMGSETLTPVTLSMVELKDDVGNVVETTVTDDYGDFVFHNLNVKNEYSIKAKEAVDKSQDEPVYVANQFGQVMGEFDKQGEGKFDYKILPAELVKISEMEEYDSKLQVMNFMEGEDLEAVIDLQIYYEPGMYEIPDVYIYDLNTIARRIKGHSEIQIEIASYTDAVGEASSNLDLSQKRAEAIVAYLIKRGIRESQIIGKGYGEEGILNRCVDGVENCSDQEHQANRRTEIRLKRETSKRR